MKDSSRNGRKGANYFHAGTLCPPVTGMSGMGVESSDTWSANRRQNPKIL
jgi:hypothetical protein